MSRSYKKHPVIKLNGGSAKWAKTHANRLFRRGRSPRELRAGKSALHHRYTDPTDRHDCYIRWTRAEAETEWESEERVLRSGRPFTAQQVQLHSLYKTKARFMNHWEKDMRRK
ncbi:MAG: hypothetical protein IK990_16175 [Ruminiclostridium sp.]|nr:hypothetical protein [Ruminiclostridium sp.]